MKLTFKRVRAFFLDNWALGLLIAGGAAIASFLLLFRLGSLVQGLSVDEFALQQQLAHNQFSLGTIIRDPLFLPYYVGLYLLQLTPFHGPTAVRSIGALFGLLGSLGFFYVLRHWYTTRIAFFGTALFATSAWFLHSARYASEDATYLLLPLLIAGVIALQARTRAKRAVLAVVVFGLLALYIPGVIWLIAAALFLKRQIIISAIKLQPGWFNAILGVLTAILLSPLVVMLAKPLRGSSWSHNILDLYGLPTRLPSVGDIAHNIKDTFADIFIYSHNGPIYTAGHLPWLDIATVALVIIGVYQFIKHRALDRSKLIAIVGIASFILVALGGEVPLLVFLPFVYLVAVEGLKWLLDSWLRVFPRNPFARSFGIVIIVLIVGTISLYQLNRYFLAWGFNPETRAVFNKLP